MRVWKVSLDFKFKIEMKIERTGERTKTRVGIKGERSVIQNLSK